MAESITEAERPPVAPGPVGRARPGWVPPAPLVGAALSGFVVGVFLTLIAVGAAPHPSSSASPPPTAPPPAAISDRQMHLRVTQIVSHQLGPLPTDPKKSRLMSVALLPAELTDVPPDTPRGTSPYRSAYIVFRLNNNPFGRAWRLKSARADVFTVMKALYTSGLPIYDVTMEGRYPLPSTNGKGKTRLRRALLVSLSYRTASHIPWHHWGRGDESRLWSQLTWKWTDPRFA